MSGRVQGSRRANKATPCYLCGKDGADTTEHVVPRCLYVGSLPSDVITLPAHERCNKSTSRDEEVFRNHISAAIPPENPGHALWAKTWKAIHRPEGAGMQSAFYAEMLNGLAPDDDGVLRPSPVVARLKRERADWVLAKIVKGLYTSQTGDLLPSSKVRWLFGQADNGHEQVALPGAFAVHDVLAVRWGRVQREPLATMWILGFYGTLWFWITTTPTTRTLSNRTRGARPMIWPPASARRASALSCGVSP